MSGLGEGRGKLGGVVWLILHQASRRCDRMDALYKKRLGERVVISVIWRSRRGRSSRGSEEMDTHYRRSA